MRNRNVSDFPWPPADFHDRRERATSFDAIALIIAIIACGVPALRAARLDPMVALRDEMGLEYGIVRNTITLSQHFSAAAHASAPLASVRSSSREVPSQ